MLLRTQWDPFEDLRSAQDEMAQLNPMLAHALAGERGAAVVGHGSAAVAVAIGEPQRARCPVGRALAGRCGRSLLHCISRYGSP